LGVELEVERMANLPQQDTKVGKSAA